MGWWVLVIAIGWGTGVGVHSVPFHSEQLCEKAKASFVAAMKNESSMPRVVATCVKQRE